MILKNRLFTRKPPKRNAKSYYIFCEGNKREYQYFCYFKELDSKINVVVIRPSPHDDNSPMGLFQKSEHYIVRSASNPSPKFEVLDIDEVWFVIDTDKWGTKIAQLRNKCSSFPNWYIAQSNPCFEVWFYYHFKKVPPSFEGKEVSKKWKQFIDNEIIRGGFDARKHPFLLRTAIDNAALNFQHNDANEPEIGCTEMHLLGQSIYPLVKDTLEHV